MYYKIISIISIIRTPLILSFATVFLLLAENVLGLLSPPLALSAIPHGPAAPHMGRGMGPDPAHGMGMCKCVWGMGNGQ